MREQWDARQSLTSKQFGRINALKRLGVKGWALGIGYTGFGAWAVARYHAMQKALCNATLNRYGIENRSGDLVTNGRRLKNAVFQEPVWETAGKNHAAG